ncbi:bifunctional diguanylate cyclase/phosphodiesterase [Agrobacterium tumefaciens]|nr:EAL domain-containing protein [Agrobacterium tumefaciens]
MSSTAMENHRSNQWLPCPHEDDVFRKGTAYNLKGEPDPVIDQIVQLTSKIFDVPTSVIYFTAGATTSIGAEVGWEAIELPHAIITGATTSPNVFVDETAIFAAALPGGGGSKSRFHAEAPLISEHGQTLGGLCIIDQAPRLAFSERERETLAELARLVVRHLALKQVSDSQRAALCLNQASQDAIIHIGVDGNVTFANEASMAIFGYAKDEILNHPIEKLLTPKLQKKMAAVIRKFRASRIDFLSFKPIEAVGLHKSGVEIPIEFSAGIWSNGGSFGMGVIIRDITERRLREASFQMLFERNPIPMWIFDAESLDFLAVNDAACRLYQYAKDEALEKNALDIRLDEERNEVRKTIKNFGEIYQSEHPGTHITATGATIKVLTYARRIRYNSRDCILAANLDVTERERAASELASTRIFLDAVVESIPSMVFVKDASDGRFVLLNKAGESLLGISRDDLIGKSDFDLFDQAEAERFRLADREVVAAGELVTIENEPLSTPGGLRSLRTQKVGVPDVDGKPRYLLGISEDVTEKLKVEERNRHLSLHDILTDLPNRLSFQGLLGEQLIGSPSRFALLLIDLDRFKAVNDSLGHHAGDELLRQLSKRMLFAKGDEDIVARLGGDEFGVIHQGKVTKRSASRLARRLISAIKQPFNIYGHSVSVGCSIGIVLSPTDGVTSDALIKRGDLALYAAKAAGTGTFVYFQPKMEEKADRDWILREELRYALDKSQLEIDYQPIIDSRSGRIVCCEALLRWRHPDRGLISPAEFIPVAEASGLIQGIGQWVLEQACHEAARWPDSVRVAVNLSPRQFTGFSLVAGVTRALERSNLAPDRLELEITESVFLTDNDENIRLLNQLKTLGVRIALDDFGTGYSSLAYLRRFSFDKLKIDQSFVAELTSSKENLAIVRAIIGLGKSFSAIVTAEGVEQDDQFTCLTAEGCDQCQGYLFSRPISAITLRRMMGSFQHRIAS